MRILRHLPFLALMSLPFMTAEGASKPTLVELPTENPTFRLAVPSGWEVTPDGHGGVQCSPSDNSKDSAYSLGVMVVNAASNDEELHAFLPKMTTQVAAAIGLKDLENGDIDTTTNDNSVPFTCMKATAKGGWLLFLQALEPKPGKFYLLFTQTTKDAYDKHEKDFKAIYNSVELLEP